MSIVESTIHPDVQRAMDAVLLPEVQELIKQLSTFGLAVAAPHMHNEDGFFVPLPENRVVLESNLKMSFPELGSSTLNSAIPVMWRWNGNLESVASCAQCDKWGGHN